MKYPHTQSLSTNSQLGMTITEVLATLFVLGIFLVVFFQAFLVLESQRIAVTQQAKANDLAHTHLLKVPTRPTALTCNTSGIDLTTLGYTIETTTGYTVSLRAYPASGVCDSTFAGSPVRIVSQVRYTVNKTGTESRVVHASFVN